MNRIDQKFEQLKQQNKKALITFITAGDPDIETTVKLVLEMEKSGADIIELGIPFSDPIAEGPVIQEASVRALAGGVNLDIIMDAVKKIRRQTQLPLVFMMYFNSIFKYGTKKFFERCADIGIDGVIVPDLPFEESGEIAEYSKRFGIYNILLVAPTSDSERMKKICGATKGFLYCVSSLGVTGERGEFKTDFSAMFDELNKDSDIPKCIGFGISTPQHVKQLKEYADGLIVGSAVVRRVADGATNEQKLNDVRKLVKELKSAFN